MDKYRIQQWKNNEEVIRYYPQANNFQYVNGILEEYIPLSRHVELNGSVMDCYQVDGVLVIIVLSNNALYQIVSDDIGIRVSDNITGPITNNQSDNRWYSF